MEAYDSIVIQMEVLLIPLGVTIDTEKNFDLAVHGPNSLGWSVVGRRQRLRSGHGEKELVIRYNVKSRDSS